MIGRGPVSPILLTCRVTAHTYPTVRRRQNGVLLVQVRSIQLQWDCRDTRAHRLSVSISPIEMNGAPTMHAWPSVSGRGGHEIPVL
ncbi:hypothetical protein GDO78_014303 [Eleutherodactylus coqui]|uniref:Uncharacterized protein n=1 Tax=Eleutherodactylus coqui TaxID=57060 RepID=A0A8J6EM11_ELECQ|nr:hypothetical protein GDO78_014303 [Eleutherodactylus coqui]